MASPALRNAAVGGCGSAHAASANTEAMIRGAVRRRFSSDVIVGLSHFQSGRRYGRALWRPSLIMLKGATGTAIRAFPEKSGQKIPVDEFAPVVLSASVRPLEVCGQSWGASVAQVLRRTASGAQGPMDRCFVRRGARKPGCAKRRTHPVSSCLWRPRALSPCIRKLCGGPSGGRILYSRLPPRSKVLCLYWSAQPYLRLPAHSPPTALGCANLPL